MTLPYHVWDAFAFGEWSRRIAAGDALDPVAGGALGAGRPLFYYAQGAIWSLTGVSFTAGRLLSLSFSLALVVLVVAAARAADARRPTEAVVALLVLAIVPFANEAIAGDTDVPAAAMTALVAWLALRRRTGYGSAAAVAAATLAALLTKPTTVAAIAALGVWLVIDSDRSWRDRLRWSIVPLAAGGAVGIAYYTVSAVRFHTGLLPFLRTGTSEGLWAQRAAAGRVDAVLSLNVLGAGLRLPLAYALVYAGCRAAGLVHRRAGVLACAGALLWAIGGPLAAGTPMISNPLEGFALVGFALLAAAAALADEADAPARATIAGAAAFGLPPLAIWAYATSYFDRLAATAWPGLTLAVAFALAPGVRLVARAGAAFALLPLTVFVAAVWLAFGVLDGMHGHEWVEYRSLGLRGVWDKERTLNIVLPQVQEALAAVKPELGADGRLSVWDPRFSFFLPGRVDTVEPLHCADVRRNRVFLLLTSDEAVAAARDAGGLATPEQWARCRSPHLVQLPVAIDGFAVFRVD